MRFLVSLLFKKNPSNTKERFEETLNKSAGVIEDSESPYRDFPLAGLYYVISGKTLTPICFLTGASFDISPLSARFRLKNSGGEAFPSPLRELKRITLRAEKELSLLLPQESGCLLSDFRVEQPLIVRDKGTKTAGADSISVKTFLRHLKREDNIALAARQEVTHALEVIL